jgi:uncharacterized membrane protein YkoI
MVPPTPKEDTMHRTTRLLAAGAVAVTAAAVGTGIAVASAQGPDDDHDDRIEDEIERRLEGTGDRPDVVLPDADLDRASSTALDHVGSGRVTGTEVGDDGPFYEIEVTLDDGTEVDVTLDEAFTVVHEEREAPEPHDD